MINMYYHPKVQKWPGYIGAPINSHPKVDKIWGIQGMQ